MNAALVLARARRTVAVVDAGEPRNAPSPHMHSFLSRDGVSPLTVLEVGRAEIERYGAVRVEGRVERLHAVELADGRTLECAGVFLFPTNEQGRLVTDRAGRTSRPGLWAVGNVVGSRAQTVTAAGLGAAAAFALNHDLVDEEVERDLAEHRAAADRSAEAPVPAS